MSRYRRARSPGGTFFFTVNLARRDHALLTQHVDLLRDSYRKVSVELPFVTVAICVLPNHLHAIWQLPEEDGDFSSRWSRIKAGFSRKLPESAGLSTSKALKREKGIWQRRFWEHQIRNGEDLRRHVDYIHFNPVKHRLVSQVQDWPHSSFHRYVRRGDLPADWGGEASEGKFGERA